MTRPDYDDVTCYLSKWSESIIDFAKSRGIDIIDLSQKRANRKNTESVINKKNPKLIIFNGHGSPLKIFGDKGEILIEFNDNHYLLESRITFSRSCSSAGGIGKSFKDSEDTTFIGYELPFVFLHNPSKSTSPLSDELARPFLQTSNIVAESLIKGSNAEEAIKKSKNAILKEIEYYNTHSTGSKLEGKLVWYLMWNLKSLKAFGKLEKKAY